jgi:PAS domain S-box-containing protein
LAAFLPCLLGWSVDLLFGDTPHINRPVHGLIEATGCGIALVVAILLLVGADYDSEWQHIHWMALGLIAMGVMDGAHAVAVHSEFWLWLRHAATLTGGLLFGMIWIPMPHDFRQSTSAMMCGAVLLSGGITTSVFIACDSLPSTPLYGSPVTLAIAVNTVGGIGFLAAALHSFLHFVRTGRTEDVVLACHAVLFATVGFLVGFSGVWTAGWWNWHVVRLLAYVVLMVAIYQVIAGLYHSAARLRRSEARWNAAIERFAEGAVIANEDERVIYWNPAALAMHGFTSDVQGTGPIDDFFGVFEFWTADGSQLLDLNEWPIRRIRNGDAVQNLELRIRRKDQGWEKCFSYSGVLVETAGSEKLIFLSISDLTDLRRTETALRTTLHQKEVLLKEVHHRVKNNLQSISNLVPLHAERRRDAAM